MSDQNILFSLLDARIRVARLHVIIEIHCSNIYWSKLLIIAIRILTLAKVPLKFAVTIDSDKRSSNLIFVVSSCHRLDFINN